MKQKTPKPLFKRLNLPKHTADFLTEEEAEHAEIALRKRGEAKRWISEFKYQNSNQQGTGYGYNSEFWENHEI